MIEFIEKNKKCAPRNATTIPLIMIIGIVAFLPCNLAKLPEVFFRQFFLYASTDTFSDKVLYRWHPDR